MTVLHTTNGHANIHVSTSNDTNYWEARLYAGYDFTSDNKIKLYVWAGLYSTGSTWIYGYVYHDVMYISDGSVNLSYTAPGSAGYEIEICSNYNTIIDPPSSGYYERTYTNEIWNGNTTWTFPATIRINSSHTVKFNLNGGTSAQPANTTKTYGTSFSMPADPTRNGYRFLGWKSNISGDNTLYKRSLGSNGGYTHDQWNGTVTLTAQWEALTYTISYNANGGSNAPESQTKTANVDLTLRSQIPVWAGHTFKNWNTAQNGTGSVYSAGGIYKANAAATLYAQWDIDPYIITFNANGGLEPPDPSAKIHGEPLRLPTNTPHRTGYTFFRWNTLADGTGQDYSPGGRFNINANTTLFAIWIQNQIPQDLIHDCYIKADTDWIPCFAYININNTWCAIKKTAINVSGTWKDVSNKV